ncbi:MAG TPA: DUF711 family protein [Steroidobacteraceae bacterium]|nr:DUF711 family protein [Steroidobacteraceae bacterium]
MSLRAGWLWRVALILAAASGTGQAQEYTKPRVRAITAFVRLERQTDTQQIGGALEVLHAAKAAFESRGYQVQTLRIVTQPLAQLVQGLSDEEALAYLTKFDAAADRQGFNANVGPAMLRDGDDPRSMRLLRRALVSLQHINASSIIAADDGIHWKVIRETASLVHYLAENSPHGQGNFNFAATAMLEPYGPFYPGAYHLGAGRQLSIGFQGANVVQEVFAHTRGDFAGSVAELTKQLSVHAKIAESIGTQVAAAADGWAFMGVDPTPAPLGEVSIGSAIESYTGAKFGSSGTMTAALIITTAVKSVPVRRVGYSGLMVPVMEDKRLAERWAEGTFNTDSLLAYSAVCGTGLDTIPYPGDIGEAQLARILGDVATLAWKWHKPLAARLQPVKGARPGDRTDFSSQYLFNTTVRELP